MKRRHLKRAAWLAVDLAEEAAARLPASCPVPLPEVYSAVWPVAVRLERLERKSTQGPEAREGIPEVDAAGAARG